MIKIGVSACFMYPDPSRLTFGPKTLSYLENDMARYLARHEVMPVLIPDLPEATLEKFLAELEGFVFQGGSDLAPQTYHEQPIDASRWPGDPQRDAYEFKILDFAKKQGLPVLGICRGCQLINAHHGGTLYQDLKTQKDNALQHRDAQEYDKVHHEIKWNQGSLLAQIYSGFPRPRVNSVHHQGIKDLGKGLAVEAISPEDGLVEAIRGLDPKQFILAVQWHPEFSHTLGSQLVPPEPLYDYFLQEVKKVKIP